MLGEAVQGDVNVLRRRPERISVFFHRSDRTIPIGVNLRCDGERILIESIADGSLLDIANPTSAPFQDECPDETSSALLRVGDVLESINGLDCKGRSVQDMEESLSSITGDACLTVCTQDGMGHGGLFQMVVIKPPANSNTAPEVGPDEESSPPTRTIDLGLRFTQRQGLLQVQGLSKAASPVVECGDIVVAMGVALCTSLPPEDAAIIWQSQIETCQSCLSLLIIRPSDMQRRWNRVRRTAVAVGGGALVGVGAVIMVTPLHPVGHAMTIGGVGVLGTEFDGPKRAIQAAKDKFRRKESNTQ